MWACAGRDAVLPHCHKVQDSERGRLLARAVWILSLGRIYATCPKPGRRVTSDFVFPGLLGEKGERGNPGVGNQGPRGPPGPPGRT